MNEATNVTLETIDPETAQAYLSTSIGNPRWTNKVTMKSKVKKYVLEMKSGNWKLSTDAIAFDTDGHLINGHHRLTSVVASGTTQQFLVARDVPAESTEVIDCGLTRSIDQRFNVTGKEIAVVNLLLQYALGTYRDTPESVRVNIANKYKDNLDKAINICSQYGGKPKSLTKNTAFILSIFSTLETGIDAEVLRRFVHAVNSGYSTGPEESAAITVRNMILDLPRGYYSSQDKGSATYYCSSIQYAIRDYVNDRPRVKKYKGDKKLVYTDEFLKKEDNMSEVLDGRETNVH